MEITNLKWYKDTDLPQGSDEWLKVRKKFGMASEVAAVLEKSPWIPASALQLWEVKNGKRDIFVSQAMRQGNEYEPVAREQLEEYMGCKFDPCVVTCEIDGAPMGASLDGFDVHRGIIAEIKVPMKGSESTLFKSLVNGDDLPDNYMLQTQQQLLVTGARELIFWVYDHENNASVMAKVYPDQEVHAKIIKAWQKYWSHDGPPPAGEKDFAKRRDLEWKDAAKQWRVIHEEIKKLEAEEKELRAKLIDMSDGKSCMGGGVRLKRTETKGRVSYGKIPELKNVDLEKYRGKPIIKYYLTEISND